MLEIRDLRKVAWRRQRARNAYVGYLTLTDQAIRLSGREKETGIDVTLSIPPTAVDRVRFAEAAEPGGEGAIVLEVADGEPIVITPIDSAAPEVDRLVRRLAAAIEPPNRSGHSSPIRSFASA